MRIYYLIEFSSKIEITLFNASGKRDTEVPFQLQRMGIRAKDKRGLFGNEEKATETRDRGKGLGKSRKRKIEE